VHLPDTLLLLHYSVCKTYELRSWKVTLSHKINPRLDVICLYHELFLEDFPRVAANVLPHLRHEEPRIHTKHVRHQSTINKDIRSSVLLLPQVTNILCHFSNILRSYFNCINDKWFTNKSLKLHFRFQSLFGGPTPHE